MDNFKLLNWEFSGFNTISRSSNQRGNFFYMLVDMKATMTKYELTQQANQFQGLQDTLQLKDFEVALQNRLLACMLSPNITAYVTEAQRHIMEFISEHPDIFKVPPAIFEDAELRSQLGKLVTKLLSTIRSQIRSQELMGADGGENVDTGAGADTQTAGTAPRSPVLLPGGQVLGPDSEFGGDAGDSIDASFLNIDTNTAADADAKGIRDTEESSDDLNNLDDNDSGFGLNGKPLRFNGTKLLNYVDYMLNLMHNTACKDFVSKQEYEGEVAHIMIQIFQGDLADCPGTRKGSKLLAVIHPQWQATIQQGLMW
ncbi:hypothetical protein PAXRUDRAFT_19184 [Paxillus rubicundulus Ve08.2h10]|uniref:Uncharacterized protein n=1 Tax=Paxillus rubicundulus Ve08.2h10 TaxID=930991 RepID=A0A0D0DCY1_9AGAM|nr:hypothetical protein PAXRUDRAFT_19184 [Paxillus rubicundulus Ve08.2h10]